MVFKSEGIARLRELAASSPSSRKIILCDIADQIEGEVAAVLADPLIDAGAPRAARVAALETELAELEASAPASELGE